MKRKKHNSIISFLLALCIIIGSLGITYNAQADDSSDATWTKIAQNSNGVLGTDAENPADVSFSNYVTAYYNQKITVEEGTRISLKVNYPQTSDGVLLQYAFALVDKVGCFYTSDATANSLMAEMYSAANASTGNGSVSKVSNNTRTWLGSLGSMQEARSTTAVYTIVYEKIDETVDEVNYSWEITMTSATGSQSYMVKASDIPHDMFKNGAYLAAGSMAGSTTHTMNISDLTITRVARWKRIAQNSNAILTSNEEKTADASFTNYVTAYYNQKINIEEGTKISFKVNFSKITENALLQYAFALVDRAGSFYVSDTDANSLMTEMYGAATSSNVYGIASKKLSSATARTWLANLTDIQEAKSTTGVYTIIYEKTNETISGENYSWKITMASATGSQSYMVKASDIPHDMFANGAYLAAGSMVGSTTHTMNISDLTITKVAGWKKIAHNSNGVLTTNEEKPADASFSNYVTAYYNQKITVEEGTRISLKVNYPQTSDGVLLQYAFALVDKVGCFYTSDATANSLMAEMYSAANASTGNGPVSKVSNNTRTWLGSLGSMQEARSTTAVYTIVYEKIDETVEEVNYSWKITMTSASGSQSCMVKASDIPHNMFANGAYLAAGSMAGSTTHTMNISEFVVEQPGSYYTVDTYKANGTYPVIDGKVFAGWFTDNSCKEVYSEKIGLAYAKFVDAKVMDVKAQISAGTHSESEKTQMRIVSTVDSGQYQEAGFILSVGESTKKTKISATDVFEKIVAKEGGVAFEYEPTYFSESSRYFYTYTITEISMDYFSTEIHVTPYWVTLDGTIVYGEATSKTVNEGIEKAVPFSRQ